MGVIIGSKAQDAVWAESVEWLSSRSGEAPAKAPRQKAKSTASGNNKARKASKASKKTKAVASASG